jgi:hypothetical protein
MGRVKLGSGAFLFAGYSPGQTIRVLPRARRRRR